MIKISDWQETANEYLQQKLYSKAGKQGKFKPLLVDNQRVKQSTDKGFSHFKGSVNPSQGGPCIVHTLGQVGQSLPGVGFSGSKKDGTYLKKRAKNAYFSKELARLLTALDSPLNKAYRRTLFDCCSTIVQEGKKLTAKYCDSRWCNTCNRIRTAKLINGYKKPLSEFSEPYFVTLTVPNVQGSDLKPCIAGMVRTFANTLKSNRRAGIAFNGIRKLECTYNAIDDNYHPHFHVIIDGEINARALLAGWLQRYSIADEKGQDCRPADPDSWIELFKYTTKLVTKTKGEGFRIYIPALDRIFQAMYRVRTFQSFGCVRMVPEEITELQSEEYEIEPYEFLVWLWEGNDWQSMTTGKALTGYKPSPRMNELLTDKVVT